jgi:hypothetical protein
MSGCGTLLGGAGLADLGDDVACVLGEGVVHRAVEVRLAAVVVDAEAAAAVDDAHVGAHHVQFDEDARGFAHGVADGADRGDLGADVEVEELKAVEHALGPQLLDRLHHLTRGEAELRTVARGLDPLAGAFRGQTRPHADHGTHVEFARAGDDRVDLLRAVDGDDDLATELLGEERRLDERLVLVSVAEDVGVGVLVQGEGNEQLGLAAGFDAEAVGRAVFDEFLDDVPLLVDLDRVDAAEPALVVVLGDGGGKGPEHLLDAELQDVGEADQEREIAAPALQILDEFLEVDGTLAHTARRDLNVARFVDGEEVLAPAVHVIELGSVFDRPSPKVCLLSQLFYELLIARARRDGRSSSRTARERADCKRRGPSRVLKNTEVLGPAVQDGEISRHIEASGSRRLPPSGGPPGPHPASSSRTRPLTSGVRPR